MKPVFMHRWYCKWKARERCTSRNSFTSVQTGAVSQIENSKDVSVGPLCTGLDVDAQRQANKLMRRFVACSVDCGHHCDGAHKRVSITPYNHVHHLQHGSTSLFKQHRHIPPALPKQIENELHFLISINHPSSQPLGWFLFFPPSPHLWLIAVFSWPCAFLWETECLAPPVQRGSGYFFLLLPSFWIHRGVCKCAEETAFITYSSRTIGPKPCVSGCRGKGKAQGVNVSIWMIPVFRDYT